MAAKAMTDEEMGLGIIGRAFLLGLALPVMP
jgi:hypothetical protein